MRMLVALLVVAGGCYRNEAPTVAPTAPVAAAPIDAPAAPIVQPGVGDDRLYASLTKAERVAFCEQEQLGTHGLSVDDARRGACRLKALPVLVTRMGTAAAARERCQKSVADCLAAPFVPDDCQDDDEKECPGITVGDYRGCIYEMRREVRYAAAEDLCETMDPDDREGAFARLDSMREGAACTAVRTKCGEL